MLFIGVVIGVMMEPQADDGESPLVLDRFWPMVPRFELW